jgi:hypothetical protein
MISFVAQTANTWTGVTGGTTTQVALNVTPHVGNTLIGAIKASGSATLNSISDPRGNSWLIDVANLITGPGLYIVRCNVVNAYSSGDHLTLNWSASINNNGMVAMEFSGLPVSAPIVDKTGLNSSTTTNTTSSCALSSATTSAADLVITAIAIGGGSNETITAPVGYTRADTSSATAQLDAGFLIAASTGTFANSWSWTAGAAYVAAMAAYLPGSQPTNQQGQFLQFMKP